MYRRLHPNEPPVAFLDGVALGPNEALIISAIWGLEDAIDRPTRLLHFKDGRVEFSDINENIVSLAGIPGPDPQTVLGLAKSGSVLEVYPNTGNVEGLGRRNARKLTRLHATEEAQFACGLNGQIYKREHERWTPFDEGTYSEKVSVASVQFRDLCGELGRRLIAVGLFGVVFELDGKRWQRVDVQTNCSLEQIVQWKPGEFWICGDKGTLLRTTKGDWEIVDSGTDKNFWGMDVFQGTLFLSAMEGIWRFDDGTRTALPVDPGFDYDVSTYRLSASGTDLWSIGSNDIVRFDGKSWHRMIVPCNE